MQRLLAFLIALSFIVCGLSMRAYAAVVIDADRTYAEISTDSSTFHTDDQQDTGGTVASKSNLPGYSSTTTSTFATPGDSATLLATFEQQRGGDYQGYSYGFITVDFTTSVNATYNASGAYANNAGFTSMHGYLYDLTANAFLYFSTQSSDVADTFILGGMGGSWANVFDGSLSGLLLAGHSYQWKAESYTYAMDSADLGATASGSQTLQIVGPAAVPELSSVVVWSLLAVTLCSAGWRRRSDS
jgi:hypothetical protein